MDSTATATDVLEPDVAATDAAAGAPGADDAILADLLIEEISIDGMCGVY